jgi:hypothetical protein
MSPREILKREFDAEEGSFLLQSRCHANWDWNAFRRLTVQCMTLLTKLKVSLLLRLGSRRDFGFVRHGFRIGRVTQSRRTRPKPMKKLSSSFMNLLTFCLWVIALTRMTHCGSRLTLNRMPNALSQPPPAVGFSTLPVSSGRAVAHLLSVRRIHKSVEGVRRTTVVLGTEATGCGRAFVAHELLF